MRAGSLFTEKEISYLRSQRLERIASVAENMQPDVAPVGFEFDGEYFYVGGHHPTATRKYKNVKNGNIQIALVVDDLVSVNPWNPHGIRVYGIAEIVDREGMFGPGAYLRISPAISWSWNIEASHSSNKTLYESVAPIGRGAR